MARNLGVLILGLLLLTSICESAIVSPVSESHRSAALELFSPAEGSFGSLEEIYEALKIFEVLGIETKPDIQTSGCTAVVDTLSSISSPLKDLFHALKVNGILKCELNNVDFGGIESRLKDSLNQANSLVDFYYSIGGLMLIKDQAADLDVHLEDADKVFRSIKTLSQSDGRWRLSSNNPDASNDAAGIALEALAGVISLAPSGIEHSLIATLKNDIMKLFDGIERYDDGTCYFDEKIVDINAHQGPLSASASVVRGVTAFAAVSSEILNLPGEKILGLAKFFLGVGIPGSAKDLYYQIDALACLENIKGSVPLILSLSSSVLSLTEKDKLKVQVSTVLGSPPPLLSVKLKQIFSSDSKDASIIDQKLEFDPSNAVHVLKTLPNGVDVGSHIFSFEVIFDDPEHKRNYVTGGRTKVPVHVTGVIQIDKAEVAVLDSDLGSVETQKLDLPRENAVALSANHLQKLRLSFHLTTPSERAFKPHQAFLKLRHETGVEHIFLVGNTGKKFEIILDFLGLVEKLYYLSGTYDIQLTVGDSAMENSFLQHLGHIELDLPEAPEKAAARPPPQTVDPYSRYGPKAEINHIFRAPDKRPPKELSLAFLGLVLVPFLGFLAGLLHLRANLKNYPKSSAPATFALLFHVGIAAVLSLYALFWLKLDLFTTLKALGLLGIFLMFVGHKTLSYLASTSAKLKSA